MSDLTCDGCKAFARRNYELMDQRDKLAIALKFIKNISFDDKATITAIAALADLANNLEPKAREEGR
jgi:hypothetical protein